MKYSLSELLDCLVDHGGNDWFFDFSPDIVIDVRSCQRQYLDQIQRIIAIVVSPFALRQLRLLAFEILIV